MRNVSTSICKTAVFCETDNQGNSKHNEGIYGVKNSRNRVQ